MVFSLACFRSPQTPLLCVFSNRLRPDPQKLTVLYSTTHSANRVKFIRLHMLRTTIKVT